MHSQICIYVCAASVQEGALTPCSSGGFPAPFSQLSSRTRLTMTFQPWLYHKCHGSRRYYFGTIALFYPDGRREKISPTNPYSPSRVLWENKCRYHQPPSAWRTMKYLCQEPSPCKGPDDMTWVGTLHTKNVFFYVVQQAGTSVLLELCCISAQSRAASPPGAVLHFPMPGAMLHLHQELCCISPCLAVVRTTPAHRTRSRVLIMPWTDAPSPSFLL